jgi:hypothetical protein
MNGHHRKTAAPAWVVPVGVALAVVGVAWLVVFYRSLGLYPVSSLGYWNLAIGFGAVVAAVSVFSLRR